MPVKPWFLEKSAICHNCNDASEVQDIIIDEYSMQIRCRE